jgi:hypothetical protein
MIEGFWTLLKWFKVGCEAKLAKWAYVALRSDVWEGI